MRHNPKAYGKKGERFIAIPYKEYAALREAVEFALSCKAEGYVSPSEPDSFESGRKKLKEALELCSKS